MALEDLLRALDADAERELDAVRTAEQQRADRMLADAHAQVGTIISAAVEAAAARARADAALVEAEARTEARLTVERAVSAALDELAMEVEQRLAELTGTAEGTEATVRLLGEAREALPTATWARVPGSAQEAAAAAAPTLTVTGELPGELAGELAGVGAVVGDEAGCVVDNTAATRLAGLWPGLRADVVRRWREPS